MAYPAPLPSRALEHKLSRVSLLGWLRYLLFSLLLRYGKGGGRRNSKEIRGGGGGREGEREEGERETGRDMLGPGSLPGLEEKENTPARPHPPQKKEKEKA